MVARGLLKPQGMRLKCSEKGLFTVSNSCPGLRQKRQIEAFSSLFFFFPYGCGDRTLCPPAFPHQRSSSGPNSGLDHCEHAKTRGRLWCGGGSRPSVCPSGVSSVFWVRSCFFFFSPLCDFYLFFSRGKVLLDRAMSAPFLRVLATSGRVCGVLWRLLLLPEPFPSVN